MSKATITAFLKLRWNKLKKFLFVIGVLLGIVIPTMALMYGIGWVLVYFIPELNQIGPLGTAQLLVGMVLIVFLISWGFWSTIKSMIKDWNKAKEIIND